MFSVYPELNELLHVLLAAVCGLIIGAEREMHGSQAGLRTYSLVSIGSCLFGIISIHANDGHLHAQFDNTRIAAQIVSGIGFLGAGIIFKEKNRVLGITTAASIWVTASIGLAISYDMLVLPLATTLLVIGIMSLKRTRFLRSLLVCWQRKLRTKRK
jgi:putative Mg2+ transporter-C (MgtC) family protein